MSYNLTFNAQTTGTQTVEELRKKVLLLQEEYRRAGTAADDYVKKVVDAEQKLSGTTNWGAAANYQKQAQQYRAELDKVIAKQIELKRSLEGLNTAQGHMVSQLQGASGAIRVFSGELPIRAVERFATSVLGLGPILQAAFPIIGALAFGEMLADVYQKLTKAKEASKELTEANQHLDQSLKDLRGENQKSGVEAVTRTYGKAAGEQQDQKALDKAVADAKLAADILQSRLDAANAELAETSFRPGLRRPGSRVPPVEATTKSQAGESVVALQRQLEAAHDVLEKAKTAAAGHRMVPIMTRDSDVHAMTDADIANARAAASAGAERASGQFEVSLLAKQRMLASRSGANLDPRQRAIEEANDAVTIAQDRADRLYTIEKRKTDQEIALIRQKQAAEGKDSSKSPEEQARSQKAADGEVAASRAALTQKQIELYGAVETAKANVDKVTSDQNREGLTNIVRRGREVEEQNRRWQEEQTRHADDIADQMARGIPTAQATGDAKLIQTRLGATVGGFSIGRLMAQRSAALSTDGSQSSAVAARLQEAAQIRSIDQQEGNARVAAEEAIRDSLSKLDEQYAEKYQEQQDKIAEINRQTNEKIYSDTTAIEKEIHDYRDAELKSYKDEVGDVFNGIINHDLPQMFRAQGEGLLKTLLENTIGPWLQKGLQAVIPTSNNPIFRNTPFGADPTKQAGTVLLTAGQQLQAAAADLQAAASRGYGGAGGYGAGGWSPNNPTGAVQIPGLDGNVLSDGSTWNGLSSADGLPLGGTPMPTSLTGIGGSSGFGFNTGTVAGIMGAGLAAYQAFRGFQKGGASGALQGTSGILGGAASIAAMTGVGAPVAIGLGIASAVTGVLGSFLDDRQRRENQINQELAANQYIAPTALNVTQDTSGNYLSINSRGGLNQTQLRAVPQVTEGFLWRQTHGILNEGGLPTYYQVPGQTIAPYSQWSAGTNPNTTVHQYAAGAIQINAVDQDSFHALVNSPRGIAAIGDSVASGIENAHSRLTSNLQYAVRR